MLSRSNLSTRRRPNRAIQCELLESRVLLAADGLANLSENPPMVVSDVIVAEGSPLNDAGSLASRSDDFHGENSIDQEELDFSCTQIHEAVDDTAPDLTQDGAADADMDKLVTGSIGTHDGDVQLDSAVDQADAAVMQRHVFSHDTGQANGNFFCDDATHERDLGIWNSDGVRHRPPGGGGGLSIEDGTFPGDLKLTHEIVLQTEAANTAENKILSSTGHVVIQPGDFNADGVIDDTDVDMLCAAIHQFAGASIFDLTQDGGVDMQDMDMLIEDVIGTRYGDANLDGRVDGVDLKIVDAHRFNVDVAAPGWANGDFSCDGIVDGTDFHIWNANRFEPPVRQDDSGANKEPVDELAARAAAPDGSAVSTPAVGKKELPNLLNVLRNSARFR